MSIPLTQLAGEREKKESSMWEAKRDWIWRFSITWSGKDKQQRSQKKNC